MNHMHLVLHNMSKVKPELLVTAGKQSGGMEVERRCHLSAALRYWIILAQ